MNDSQIDGHLKFMFNAQVSPLEDIWMEGYFNGQKGNIDDDNPYDENSKPGTFWLEGWHAGFYKESSLIDHIEPEHYSFAHHQTINHHPVSAKEPANQNKWQKWLYSSAAVIATSTFVTIILVDLAA